jgi:phenylacetate-CoA ligase
MHDATFTHVRQFQFRQEVPGRAVLRLVPAEAFSQSDRDRMVNSLRLKLDGRIDFEVELTPEIPLTARGKRTYVDQRIRLDELAAHAP